MNFETVQRNPQILNNLNKQLINYSVEWSDFLLKK